MGKNLGAHPHNAWGRHAHSNPFCPHPLISISLTYLARLALPGAQTDKRECLSGVQRDSRHEICCGKGMSRERRRNRTGRSSAHLCRHFSFPLLPRFGGFGSGPFLSLYFYSFSFFFSNFCSPPPVFPPSFLAFLCFTLLHCSFKACTPFVLFIII